MSAVTLPKGWTVEKLLANKHVGAASLGASLEEGKAIRAAIDALLTRSGGGAFGPALLANSVEEMEAMKRELRGETMVESAPVVDEDAPAPQPRKRNRSRRAA